ncbi:MAG: oxidoreductase [Synechococcaceae bacterium WBB_3_034]|nr:oxidoreductase [Synechococcaceae bacterium WBB_3_034]
MSGRPRLATVWLSGCSGCHMSFLDLDLWLLELAELADIVYSPVASDVKHYPEAVDIVLVEGAVATTDNLQLLRQVRANSRTLVSFGDCALTANVPGMRNPIAESQAMLQRVYGERPPDADVLPRLLPQARPLHELVPVEVFLPGCPPSAAAIRTVLEALLRGEQPRLPPDQIRFG